MTAMLSILDRVYPKGFLVSVVGGEMMSSKIEFLNNERYPVLLSHIWCDISGEFKITYRDLEDDIEDPVRARTMIISGGITSNRVGRIIESGETEVFQLYYTGRSMALEDEISFRNADDIVRSRVASLEGAALEPKDVYVYKTTEQKSCIAYYNTPGPRSRLRELSFENRYIEHEFSLAIQRVVESSSP